MVTSTGMVKLRVNVGELGLRSVNVGELMSES